MSERESERKRDSLIGGIPLNTSEIPQPVLNIESKDRSNLFPWSGQFSPQFVEALIDTYAVRGTVILDPFAGSGTVLYEAGRKKLRAVAAEINPAAYLMASVYRLINSDSQRRSRLVSKLDEILNQAFPEDLPLFSLPAVNQGEDEIKRTLAALALGLDDSFPKLLLQAMIVRLDFYQAGLSRERIRSAWGKLKSLTLSLPYSENHLEIYNCDARALPLADDAVDLVITSPPYINVFNYHQQYRASAEALGWDLLSVAKSEIGSNRKHRGNRFLTVIQYCLDLAQVLARLSSIVKSSGRIIFVIGRESRVRGVPFFNGEIVSELGTRCVGFQLKTRQERVFKNKFGELIYEDILHFTHPPDEGEDVLLKTRRVAGEIIEEAMKSAPPDVLADLGSARERVSEIEPSRIYQAEAASGGNIQKPGMGDRNSAKLSHPTP